MFTGNAFILYNGLRRKLISVRDVLCLWAVCYGGNWLGAAILSLLFYGAGYDTGTTAEAITEAAAMKMSLPPLELFFRGILCNILVCLAIWSSFRCHSDAGKLIMTFWCLYVFYTLGFEHCIAMFSVKQISPFSSSEFPIVIVGKSPLSAGLVRKQVPLLHPAA